MWMLAVDAGAGEKQVARIDTNIPPENQVNLKGDWRPTAEQTEAALKAVQKFLEQPKGIDDREQGEIRKILANSSKYSVQFTGVSRFGIKTIRCNFFRRGGADPDWKTQKVEVKDDGFWYWHIEYDIQKGQCLNFSSNGYA
jgi:hypothetical protein